MNHENPMEPPNGIATLPNGQWYVAHDTHIGKWSREHGSIVSDPYLLEWLKPHLANVKTVWDIGANIGDHTRWYLDQGFTVVAVEPNPLAFACLTHNCPEAIAINAAASDTAGEPLRFLRSENVGASRVHAEGDILVYPVVLDEENLPKPDFLKIDCEGWEPYALRGMSETLRKHRPFVLCEINKGALMANGFSPAFLIEWMKGFGYSADTLYPETARHGDEQYDILFTP